MKERQTFVCDVLVIGGSLEGCIAALEVSGEGKKVLLAEEGGALGGMASGGLMTYIPLQRANSAKVREYAENILQDASEQSGQSTEDCTLFNDQKLKVVLRRMLDAAGVTVLTHVYPADMLWREGASSKLPAGLRFCTKTGWLDVEASVVIDGTDLTEAGCMAGLAWKKGRGCAVAGVKFNGIGTDSLRLAAASILEETRESLTGTVDCGFSADRGDLTLYTERLLFLHSKCLSETVLYGLSADLKAVDCFTLSDARAELRILAYGLRDWMRENLEGFGEAGIIHVAPLISCYGLRIFDSNPYDTLILLNQHTKEYDNINAIAAGIEGAGKALGRIELG